MNKLYNFAQYDRFLIKGFPFIVGRPNFQPYPVEPLTPGTKVRKIGGPGRNGGATSSHRIDTWEPWVEYAGIVYVNLLDEDKPHACAAFRLPPGGMVDKVTGQPAGSDYFALYAWTNLELIRPNFNRQTVWICSPVFTLADTSIIK